MPQPFAKITADTAFDNVLSAVGYVTVSRDDTTQLTNGGQDGFCVVNTHILFQNDGNTMDSVGHGCIISLLELGFQAFICRTFGVFDAVADFGFFFHPSIAFRVRFQTFALHE